jgi:hypothetical protein
LPANGVNLAVAPRINPKVTRMPAAQPSTDEESIPWEQLAHDTDDAAPQTDPKPRPTPSAADGSRPRPRVAPPQTLAASRRIWWVAGSVTVLVLAGLIVLWSRLGPEKHSKTDPRPVLEVRQGAGEFRSITDALKSKQALNGEVRIVIFQGHYREQIELRNKTGITVEAANGNDVVIMPPATADENDPLLKIIETKDVHFKGIALDGEGRLKNLVAIQTTNPGLLLENLRLEGFTQSAVEITNCAGDSAKPVQLLHLEINPDKLKAPAPAIVFRSKAGVEPQKHAHIFIKHCQFNGDFTNTQPIEFDPKSLDGRTVLFEDNAVNKPR